MHLPLLQDLLVLLGFSVVIVFLLQRIKLPSILGFLAAGMLIGPYGLGLVSAVKQVEIISEIGVILLMFVIGMELSIRQLWKIKKTVFLGGFVQVGLTIATTAVLYYLYKPNPAEACFIGFLVSLSSTAIVLKVLQDRNEIQTPHGRNALGILIFQDIIVVPMMLLTPIMAGQTNNVTYSIVSLLIKSAVVFLITILSARYIIPKLMHAIAKTRNKELFLLTTITICFAVTFITSEAGLSLALGAFLAGLIIAESEYSHQATSIILPFRELFTSFFFISVGMMLDLQFFINHVPAVILLTILVLFLKFTITALAVAMLRYPPKTILLTSFSLFQIGEFAFILSKTGMNAGLLQEDFNQYFLAVSITSMLISPFAIMLSTPLSEKMVRSSKLLKKIDSNSAMEKALNQTFEESMENHLVIIGYGINGSNLAKAAQFTNIPFVIIELNAETVVREKAKGIPILYGDASYAHILNHANVHKARAVVVAISDLHATRNVVSSIRSISQSVYLLVRTRYVKEINEFKSLGADEVIPEEFETSIEIFTKVLHSFLVPEDDIEQMEKTIRSDNYEVFQSENKRARSFRHAEFPEFNITCLRVNADSGKVIGTPMRELLLRTNYGVNILGINRKGSMMVNLSPDESIRQGDVLYVHGKSEDIESFNRLIG